MNSMKTEGFALTLDLLAQAKQGDGAALSDLLERYSDRVLEVVRIRLGRPLRESLESRDILQETMIDAFQGFDRYELREDAHFVNWLARIAEHRILRSAEYHGAQKRDSRRAVPLEGKRGPDSEVVSLDPPSILPGAATQLVNDEQRDMVADCVASLPDRYREVIAMRDYVGAEWEEVAKETGHSSANAARMTHNRARMALGKMLRQRGMV